MRLRCLLLSLALLAAAHSARAHLASDSYLRIETDAAGMIGGQWDIALRDLDVAVGLDADQDGAITWGEVQAKQREIETYAFGHLALAGESFLCRLIPAALMVDYHAGAAYAVLPFTAECPSGGRLTLRYRLLFDLDPSHRGLLTIAAGGQVSSDVLTPEHADIIIDAGPLLLADQVTQFLRFGIDHILGKRECPLSLQVGRIDITSAGEDRRHEAPQLQFEGAVDNPAGPHVRLALQGSR